ncbi:DUF58 domain-containing protein [Kineococcus sp. SYSU DK006]|uniref:DUF58 domain-containing protein n=1 Tax=Kineococcus sp. SYSU DK006 TaxID=3383127 RepID=UPI003D7ED76D
MSTPSPAPGAPAPGGPAAVALTGVEAGRALRWRAVLGSSSGPVLLLLSFGVGNRWLGLLAALVLAATAVAVCTLPRVASLAVSVRVPARTRAGEHVEHVVDVVNHGSRPCPPTVVHLAGDGFADVHATLPAVPAGQAVRLVLPRRALRRCVSTGPLVRVEGADALGLLTTHRAALVPALVHVHPAPAAAPALPPPPVAGTDDVAGVRPWRRGDRLSAVHWRASARRGGAGQPGGGLVVVEREAEPAGPLVLVLGAGAGADPGADPQADPEAWEQLLAAAATLVLREGAAGRRVGVLADDPLREGAGAARVVEGAAALDALAAAGDPRPLGQRAAVARRLAGRGGRVLVGTPPSAWREAP